MSRRSDTAAPERSIQQGLVGRLFVHPLFDYLLIGGGLSLMTLPIVAGWTGGQNVFAETSLPYILFASTMAHFASSTVRLYTKPQATASWPFLTMVFPLLALAVLTLCISQPQRLGAHLQGLYLTWSPYHYAAQAYGLTVMYCYRSGCLLPAADKKLLWWVSMLPFFFSFLFSTYSGARWLLPAAVFSNPVVEAGLAAIRPVLSVLVFLGPVAVFFKVWRSAPAVMPLIGPLMLIANGIWWLLLSFDAFVWATVFHGLQYLAIVVIFHLKDQRDLPGNHHGTAFHVVKFYGLCLLLGYGLFKCLPLAYVWAGFGFGESLLLVTAAINLHHFIVDAYIWRLKKSDPNRRIVDEGLGLGDGQTV